MNDTEKEEIEQIKKELDLHEEHEDLEMLRLMKRISDGMDEAQRIMNQANNQEKNSNVFCRIKKRLFNTIKSNL